MSGEIKSTTSDDGDAIVTEIHIAASRTRVFQALTDRAALVRWFTDPKCPIHQWEIDARLGGRYRYSIDRTTAAVHHVDAFECHGTIVEFDPPRVLAYTWNASWHADTSRPTVVRWELTPEGDGTRVQVTHGGLATEPAARQSYTGGWSECLSMLRSFAEQNVTTMPHVGIDQRGATS